MKKFFLLFSLCLTWIIGKSQDTIRCYGDSFTQGAGSTAYSYSYPSRLSVMLHLPTFNFGVGGQNSKQVVDRLIADQARKNYPTIIWVGRNGVDGDTANIRLQIDRAIAAMGHDRYLIIEILNGNRPEEKAGERVYNLITSVNNRLEQIYTYHFVRLRSALVNAYDPNNAWDVQCKAWDVPPTSLRSDSLHLNNNGYGLVAQKISQSANVLGVNSALPLTFEHLTATATNGNVLLKWNVSDDFEASSYVIQRSTNGINFEDLAFLPAKGTEKNEYSWTDSRPNDGNNFYRIKANKSDGNFLYSVVVIQEIHASSATIVTSFGNSIRIQIRLANENINIYDQGGRLIKANIKTSSTLALYPSIYFVHISSIKKTVKVWVK